MIPKYEKDFEISLLQPPYTYGFSMIEGKRCWGMVCPEDYFGIMYSPIVLSRTSSGIMETRVPHRMVFFQDVNFFEGMEIKDIYDSKI